MVTICYDANPLGDLWSPLNIKVYQISLGTVPELKECIFAVANKIPVETSKAAIGKRADECLDGNHGT